MEETRPVPVSCGYQVTCKNHLPARSAGLKCPWRQAATGSESSDRMYTHTFRPMAAESCSRPSLSLHQHCVHARAHTWHPLPTRSLPSLPLPAVLSLQERRGRRAAGPVPPPFVPSYRASQEHLCALFSSSLSVCMRTREAFSCHCIVLFNTLTSVFSLIS